MHLPSVLVHTSQLNHISSCCRGSHLSTTPRLFLLYVFTSLNYTTSLPAVRVHIYQLHHASSFCTCSHHSTKPRLFLLYVFITFKNTSLFLLYIFTSLNYTTSLPAVRVHICQLNHVSSCCTCSHLSTTQCLLLLYVYTSLNNTMSLAALYFSTTLRVCNSVHLCGNVFSRQPATTTNLTSPSLFFA